MEARIREHGLPTDAENLRMLKAMGFSDARLATLTGKRPKEVAELRNALNVRPVYKRIDTCAPSSHRRPPNMYSTYETPFVGAARSGGAGFRSEKGRHPRRRTRTGSARASKFELLLLPCRLRTEGRRLRSDHDQLQPGDGFDRLRHLRPALFRAPDGRGRDRDHACRTGNGTLHGVIVQFGGQTSAEACRSAGKERHPDPRHRAGRESTSPRTVIAFRSS